MNKKNFVLAVVVFSLMLSNTVMASSMNSVSGIITDYEGHELRNTYLNIRPDDVIVYGDSIAITVENGEFLEQSAIDAVENSVPVYQYYAQNGNGKAYKWDSKILPSVQAEGAMDEYLDEIPNSSGYGSEIYRSGAMYENPKLPYKITRNSAKEIQIILYPISSFYVGTEMGLNKTKVHYSIPLPIKMTTEGEVKIKVDSNETSISGGGTYRVAYTESPQNPIVGEAGKLTESSTYTIVYNKLIVETYYINNTGSKVTKKCKNSCI